MRQIGFSTGAVARGDFRLALEKLRERGVTAVEISALRLEELAPLASAIPELDLSSFSFVSIHAPSRFDPEEENWVVAILEGLGEYPVVVHPDVITRREAWKSMGNRLLIENMDKRKAVGRSVRELAPFFESLPAARFCFDIGHARQVDPSMTEASSLLRAFRDRIAEVHMSEVNTGSRHDPISTNAVWAFSRVASGIPEEVPIILETLIDRGQSDIASEIRKSRAVFAEAAAYATS